MEPIVSVRLLGFFEKWWQECFILGESWIGDPQLLVRMVAPPPRRHSLMWGSVNEYPTTSKGQRHHAVALLFPDHGSASQRGVVLPICILLR